MAKCSACNFQRGKRKCLADTAFICSLCCGQTRTPEKCTGCSFYMALCGTSLPKIVEAQVLHYLGCYLESAKSAYPTTQRSGNR
jgi:hypothetical protein